MAENAKRQHLILAGLVGVAALVVLYLLYRESQATPASAPASTAPPEGTGIASYPNPQPINMGDVNIVQGSSPQSAYNLANPLPDVSVSDPWDTGGACDGCKDVCEQVGTVVSTQQIAPAVLQNAQDNLSSFQEKTTSGVEAARVQFSQGNIPSGPVGGSFAA